MDEQPKALAKAIHWRALELARWAAQHGDVGTFRVHRGEIHDKKRVFHAAQQVELMAKMSDANWKVVHFEWYVPEFRSGAMLYTIDLLPSRLLHANVPANIWRYVFKVANETVLRTSLKAKRSQAVAKKKSLPT